MARATVRDDRLPDRKTPGVQPAGVRLDEPGGYGRLRRQRDCGEGVVAELDRLAGVRCGYHSTNFHAVWLTIDY